MNTMYLGTMYRWLVVAVAVIGLQVAFAADPVGKVLMTTGSVSAKASGGERALQRKSDVFVGDTVVTGKDSQVQLRMNDGALIALGAGSEFEVKSYRYNEAGKKDEVALALIKGGLRTITGQVDKSGYKMTTPAATLGIRGTIFEVHVAADGTTTVILRDGGVDVTGQVGDKIKLDLANLASIIQKGGAAGKPGPIPDDILKLLQSILPIPPGGGSMEGDGEGGTTFSFDVDPGSILTDPTTGPQPPTADPSGDPPIDNGGYCSNC